MMRPWQPAGLPPAGGLSEGAMHPWAQQRAGFPEIPLRQVGGYNGAHGWLVTF